MRPVEVAAHHPAAATERVGLAEELLREPLVAGGCEHPNGGLEPFGENDSISKRRAEPRRDREAVLRVEIVLVLTKERQSGLPLRRSSWTPLVRSGPGW